MKKDEDYYLLKLAQKRLANNNLKNAIPEADVMKTLGITEDDIEKIEDKEDVIYGTEAYTEYLASEKKCRPISELWKEINL